MKAVWFGASLVALTLAIQFSNSVSAANAPAASQPSAAEKVAKHYDDRVAQFQRENAAAKTIVIVGDSHTEGLDVARYLPGRHVLNRGIGSDRIGVDGRGVLGRLDSSVFDCNPGFILLENGVNDLGELWRNGKPSMDEIDAAYRKVVERIRGRLPEVPLVIVGIFPTRDRYAGLNPLILQLNQRLAKIAADTGCRFMETYKPLVGPDGELRKEYSRDGLHLTPAGYGIWVEQIKAVLPLESSATQPAESK